MRLALGTVESAEITQYFEPAVHRCRAQVTATGPMQRACTKEGWDICAFIW
jgi:hypothetical protein